MVKKKKRKTEKRTESNKDSVSYELGNHCILITEQPRTSSKITSPNLHRSVRAKQTSVCFSSNSAGAYPAVTKSLTHQTVSPEWDMPSFLELFQAFSPAFQPPVYGVHPGE